MKKAFALIWLVVGCSVCAWAQTDNGRDLSKYADDKVTLVNKSGVISYLNILKAKDAAGNLVVPVTWSDNFFPILPGETKVVTFTAGAKDLHIELDN